MNQPKVAIVIPARLESTRLPGKLLLNETSKALIQYSIENALQSKLANKVIVATDSEEIAAQARVYSGVSVFMSQHACPTGTHRVRCALDYLPVLIEDYQYFINLQPDEPELSGHYIDQLINFIVDGGHRIATLSTNISSYESFLDTNCVKVVCRKDGRALYFSRAPVPYQGDAWRGARLHLGVYGYHWNFLSGYSRKESCSYFVGWEGLEQLAWLDDGEEIFVKNVIYDGQKVDTRDDYTKFVAKKCRNLKI